MTSFARERDAFAHMIDTNGAGVYSCVMDSYDYERALNVIVPSLKAGLAAVAVVAVWLMRDLLPAGGEVGQGWILGVPPGFG